MEVNFGGREERGGERKGSEGSEFVLISCLFFQAFCELGKSSER